jgi:hypothetical protein
VALRREELEQLESNDREKWATGREDKTNRRRHKHSPRKERNGSTPVDYSRWITLKRNKCWM